MLATMKLLKMNDLAPIINMIMFEEPDIDKKSLIKELVSMNVSSARVAEPLAHTMEFEADYVKQMVDTKVPENPELTFGDALDALNVYIAASYISPRWKGSVLAEKLHGYRQYLLDLIAGKFAEIVEEDDEYRGF